MSYSYDKETNKYARNRLQYRRWPSTTGRLVLKQIDYGTRTDRTGTAPMQVAFDVGRPLPGRLRHRTMPQHWPDVPWDQECTGESMLTPSSPSFWTTKRLASVTTRVGGQPGRAGGRCAHSFPDPGDGTRAGLWLDKISRIRSRRSARLMCRTSVSLGIQLSNRVDTHSDQLRGDERGGGSRRSSPRPVAASTSPTRTADCVPGSRMPNSDALQDNNLRCYPVRWTPPGNTTPIWDYFHKYVVKSVTEADLTGALGARPHPVRVPR